MQLGKIIKCVCLKINFFKKHHTVEAGERKFAFVQCTLILINGKRKVADIDRCFWRY